MGAHIKAKKKIMKILFKLFAISGTASAAAATQPKEAACEDGIHAHEEHCNMFYQCANGHRYPDQSCPDGLLFNPDVMVCDWPDNVDCGSEPSKWDCYKDCVGDKWWNPIVATKCSKDCFGWNKRVAKEAKEEAACEDGIHAHATKCNMFYQCANGHQYPDQECPDGLMYNSEAEYCDWPDNVTCPEPPKTCNRGDKRPHETNCKKYYKCDRKGNESVHRCGFGEIFNAKKLECDYEWKPWVNCDL